MALMTVLERNISKNIHVARQRYTNRNKQIKLIFNMILCSELLVENYSKPSYTKLIAQPYCIYATTTGFGS